MDEGSPAEQRAHDIGNALHLVNGAIHALDSFGAELTEQEREELDQAVESSLKRLAVLLTADAEEIFPLDAAAAEAVDQARSQDINVRVRAEASLDIRAHRSELTRVLAAMLMSVCVSVDAVLLVHASGSDAILRLERNRDGEASRSIGLRFPSADAAARGEA